MTTNVQQRVIKAIAEVLERKANEITSDASLQDDLGFNSLKQMTLFIVLEDEFQLNLPPEDVTGITTVKDVVDFIEKRLQKSAPT